MRSRRNGLRGDEMPYMILYTDSIEAGIDIIGLIEEIKWSENDLDAPNAGRTLDGLMHRGKVTSKHRADIKLLPEKASTINPVLAIVRNEYFYCNTDLVPDGPLTMEMYNSVRSGGIMIVNTDRVIIHKDVAFNIIER